MKIEVRRPYLLQKQFMAFSHYGLIRFVGQLGFFNHSQNTLEEVKTLNSEDPPPP